MLWDSDQYWKKAARYVEMASQSDGEPWERPFWLSLALEFLARAALTKIHPALNADPQGDGINILHAFGFELQGQPKSIPTHAVLGRLQKIYPDDFTKPHREFCDYFSNLRNQELHTSDLNVEGLLETKWLAQFYAACGVLCHKLGKDLEDLFGTTEAETAAELISALAVEKQSSVKSKIAAHAKVFESKPEPDQKELATQQVLLSKTWISAAGQVACPACNSIAKLQGSIERVSKPIYQDGELFVKNIVLANRMVCKACGLVLNDIDEIHIAKIEPHYEYLEAVDLHDLQQFEFEEEYMNM